MHKVICLYILLIFSIADTQALTFSAGKDNVVHQVASAVLLKAYARIGITPQFVYMPLQKSLDMSNAGQTDGETARVKAITRLYPNLVEVPVAINFVEGIAFSKDSTVQIHKWGDLQSYKIAVVRGAKFIEISTDDMNRVLVEEFKDAFTLLDNNEVDLVVAPKITGIYITHKLQLKDIHPVGSVLQKLDLYHFLHKNNAHLVPQLTQVLESMQQSGEITFIRASYHNQLLGF